jgi:hypothetical protein
MEHITSLLNSFDRITLEEMEPVKLMDRIDKKFAFHLKQLSEVLNEIRKDYFVLEVKGQRSTTYQTIYFDTHKYDCFLKHHNGRLNRYKFRSRQYVESNLNFFELKFKSNKGRTQKERIRCQEQVKIINGRVHDFMQTSTGLNPSDFYPKMFIDFIRITFVSKQLDERVTMDLNLHFKNDEGETTYNNLVIVEAKMDSAKKSSSIVRAMKKFRVQEKSISKYCLGVALLVSGIKKNTFKSTILFLNKLLKDERPVLEH